MGAHPTSKTHSETGRSRVCADQIDSKNFVYLLEQNCADLNGTAAALRRRRSMLAALELRRAAANFAARYAVASASTRCRYGSGTIRCAATRRPMVRAANLFRFPAAPALKSLSRRRAWHHFKRASCALEMVGGDGIEPPTLSV